MFLKKRVSNIYGPENHYTQPPTYLPQVLRHACVASRRITWETEPIKEMTFNNTAEDKILHVGTWGHQVAQQEENLWPA